MDDSTLMENGHHEGSKKKKKKTEKRKERKEKLKNKKRKLYPSRVKNLANPRSTGSIQHIGFKFVGTIDRPFHIQN